MAQVEIHAAVPLGIACDFVFCLIDWQTVTDYRGINVEYRGARRWEKHIVWKATHERQRRVLPDYDPAVWKRPEMWR